MTSFKRTYSHLRPQSIMHSFAFVTNFYLLFVMPHSKLPFHCSSQVQQRYQQFCTIEPSLSHSQLTSYKPLPPPCMPSQFSPSNTLTRCLNSEVSRRLVIRNKAAGNGGVRVGVQMRRCDRCGYQDARGRWSGRLRGIAQQEGLLRQKDRSWQGLLCLARAVVAEGWKKLQTDIVRGKSERDIRGYRWESPPDRPLLPRVSWMIPSRFSILFGIILNLEALNSFHHFELLRKINLIFQILKNFSQKLEVRFGNDSDEYKKLPLFDNTISLLIRNESKNVSKIGWDPPADEREMGATCWISQLLSLPYYLPSWQQQDLIASIL